MAEHKLDRSYTFSEYLQLEQADPQSKYEFVNGQIYAMAGGSIKHGLLISNTLYWIREAIRRNGKTCKTFSGEVKVAIDSANSYLYPDVFVVCGEIDDQNQPNRAISNPNIIIEVLSPSTQNYDQTHKFRLYRTIPTLESYLMVDQEQAIIESFNRMGDDQWRIQTFMGLDKEIELKAIGANIRMKDIYEDVLT